MNSVVKHLKRSNTLKDVRVTRLNSQAFNSTIVVERVLEIDIGY